MAPAIGPGRRDERRPGTRKDGTMFVPSTSTIRLAMIASVLATIGLLAAIARLF